MLVFLVGFIVAVVIPAVKEAELSLAVASARSAAVSFEAKNPGFSVKQIGYTVNDETVLLEPKTFYANGTAVKSPPELSAAILAALKNSVASKTNVTCATAANYEYCLQTG